MEHSRSLGLRSLCVLLACLALLAGCSKGARKGAAVGGAVGAATGAVIGHRSGNTGKGAATGAVVGAAAGAIIGDYMEKQKKELEKVPGADVEREGDELRVTFNNAILFDFDSSLIRPDARDNLDKMAAVLIKYPETDIIIIGHTDAIGTYGYNQRLSERRATAVRNYLASQAVARQRMRSRGMGESEPVASNDTEEGRAKNRRVEVKITPNAALRQQAQEQASADGR